MDSESLAHTKWNCKYHIVVRTEVQKAGGLRPAAHGDRKDTEGAVQEEGDRDPGGRSMPRSYTHAAVDTAEIQRVERDGVPEGEEQPDDSRT